MKGLTFLGYNDITLNDTVDAEYQNNSAFKSTTYGHQFGKTYYYESIFMCSVLIWLPILIIILNVFYQICCYIFSEENITTLNEINHTGQNETDGGHQSVIFWVSLGLCVLFCAWLCYYFRRIFWHRHRIIHLYPFPTSQSNYTLRRLTIMGPKYEH